MTGTFLGPSTGEAHFHEMAHQQVRDNPGTSLYVQIPCETWVKSPGARDASDIQCEVKHHIRQLKTFIDIAESCLRQGGHLFFIWPRTCAGRLRREPITFIDASQLHTIEVGPMRLMTSSKNVIRQL